MGPSKCFAERNMLKQQSHDILGQPEFYDNLKKIYPNKEVFSAYVGFDPTANSLHLGNLIQIIAMIRLSLLGLKPLLLIGGATGQIGDPSGKSVERQMLTKETVQENIKGVKDTLTKVADSIYGYINNKYGLKPQYQYEVVNNEDFYKNMTIIDFIRDTGKYLRMGNLLSKDSISSRLSTEQGLSFTEFTYTVLQGYDYEKLFIEKNCILQIGGSDQFGNIVTGFDLIKKKHQSEVYCMTIPLITTASGQKFGKSEGNALWVDLEKASSYDLYQYLFNLTDDLALDLLKMFTFIPLNEIKQVREDHLKNPEQRIAQKLLANTIIDMLSFNLKQKQPNIQELMQVLFKTDFSTFKDKSIQEVEEFFDQFQEQKICVSKQQLNNCRNVSDLIVDLGQVKRSKSDIRRQIKNGGVQINSVKVLPEQSEQFNSIYNEQFLIHSKYMSVRVGKKNYLLFKFE